MSRCFSSKALLLASLIVSCLAVPSQAQLIKFDFGPDSSKLRRESDNPEENANRDQGKKEADEEREKARKANGGVPVGFIRVSESNDYDPKIGYGWLRPKKIVSYPLPKNKNGQTDENGLLMSEEEQSQNMEDEEAKRMAEEQMQIEEEMLREQQMREEMMRREQEGDNPDSKPAQKKAPKTKKKPKKKRVRIPKEPAKEIPPFYSNEMTKDGLSSTEENTFVINLKSGNYYVYTWSGLSEGSASDYQDFEISFGSRDSTVKIPGPYRFEKRVFRVKPQSRGQLKITFKPNPKWVLSGMVIFPVSQERRVKADFLDEFEKEINFLPPELASEWVETKNVDDYPQPKFSSIDKKREFAIFSKHYSELVYSNTVPREHQFNPDLKLFAAPGEYEPVTFTIHPLVDLRGARVTCSELKNGGSKISESDISIRYVKYMLARPNYSAVNSYKEVPDVLEEHRTLDMPANINQRVWMTIKVPDDAKPGMYEGKVTVQGNRGKSTTLNLSLKVLPIKLQSNPEQIFGIYYRDPLEHVSEDNSKEANEYLTNKARWEREDMVAHGLENYIGEVHGLDRDKEGVWTIDSEPNTRWVEMDKKYGLLQHPRVVFLPIDRWYKKLVDPKGQGSHLSTVIDKVPAEFYEEVTKMVETIEKERKSQGWPEFIYYPIDEPSTSKIAVDYTMNVLKAIHQVKGVKTYLTADPTKDAFQSLWPHVNIWSCQPFVYSKAELAKIRKTKKVDIWCYPNHVAGENDHTPVRGARMTFGFGLWKSGVNVLVPWIYQYSEGDPWNYLDGSQMDFFNRSTPEGRPVPVTLWEAYREGIDDNKYIYTLEQMIKKAKAKGGSAEVIADQSAEQLKMIYESFEAQKKYQYDDLWPGRDFDAYRWVMASEIIRLQRAVK